MIPGTLVPIFRRHVPTRWHEWGSANFPAMLVLLHGAYMTVGTIGPILPGLAETRRVIAVELQGHGRTADIDRPITYEHMADDVAALIRHLDLDHPDVFGFSILLISNGMDLSRFHPGNDGDDFKLKYGIPEQPTFMYVGRLDAEKRVDELIRALPLVRKSVDAQLVIVGDGHERRELIELAEREGVEGYVIFTGFVEDEELPGAYAASDVFSNAGIAELRSIVTMEAMATGKPIVAANATALSHLVHHEENGYLFEPGDVKDLASRLAELLSDEGKRTEMGSESLRIVARHDIEEVLVAFENLFELAMPRRRDAGKTLTGILRSTVAGAERIAAFVGEPMGGVHEGFGTSHALRW